ncbi:plasmid partitioning protein RepB [Agrobacterium genomosp. 3]|uniref:plasmid partitioning protein RepB n=1 Tax=Agrobacterium tomkonis TaxID=1183410 RepID=UPI001CD8657C|nr:plasmid partitioning protein RepB [Agrobacterium tomkonis]MCA1878658.1 plasmid partitioning protein RepB [Agrobacterium tumefaciens]MCA1893883.1 plasmid partitioning protein RepB [Agrobacterium tomkonis]
MSKRSDALKGFLEPIQTATEPAPRAKPAVQSGALNSMNQAIANLATEAEQAEQLRAQLEAGETIIEIDPGLIHTSFVRDRLDDLAGQDFVDLKESMRNSGQIVPVLVRPHPERKGEYQLAFGHRRVEALRQLRGKVKAIVRNLSDEDLIVAQGKENTDRTDLSFIEKALFALRLEQKGIRRQVIMDALTTTSKGVLSGMISLASSMPTDLIEAIGPAPAVGRPRWEALAQTLTNAKNDDVWRRVTTDEEFRKLASDGRFDAVLKAITARRETVSNDRIIQTQEGRRIATAQFAKRAVRLTIQSKDSPDFAEFLLKKLPDIYAAYVSQEAGTRQLEG